MKKLKTAVVSMFVCAVAATCFAACRDDKKPEEPKTLAAPEIVLNDDFSVSWEAVNDATAYVVNVNGDDLKAQQTLTFDALAAVNTYTVKVKAKNDEAVSDYSAPVTYSVFGVTLAEGEGYELQGAATVYGGKDYSFTLTLAGEAYEGSVPVVKANDEVLTEADGKYTVTNVSSALNITVEGVAKRTFAVSIPSGDGYTVTGESEATYGEDFSFTVAKNAGYDQSTLTVKVNGEAVTEENGKYTVKNVKTVLNITVEGAAKNQYAVTLPSSVAYTIAGAEKAVHGEEYSFTLEVKDGYDTANLTVKANGALLTVGADGRTYTVENVTGALEITVEGLNIRTYAVTLTAGEGYTLSGSATAEHGADYTFTFTLNEGYSKSSPIVKANGTALTAAADGKTYTVKNVTAALEITVEGITINTYKVSVAEGTGFTVTGARETTAEHGAQAQFTIAAQNPEDEIRVFNGETEVTGIGNVYTLSNITGDVTLTVKVYDLAAQFALNVNAAVTEADGVITIASSNIQVSAAYLKKLTDAGYTHMKFSIDVTNGDDILICHSGTWSKYYRVLSVSGDTARIDLTEFTDEENTYAINIEGRGSSSASLAVSEITLYKSAETVKWTKSNSNIYCAEEDGFIVLETRAAGNDAHILSSTEWWAKYANNSAAADVSQRSVILSGKYLSAGSNNRGAVFGGFGGAAGTIGGTANTEIVTGYMNNLTYAEGNKFYYGLDKEGVYALKVSEFVSNRNSDGGFSYTDLGGNRFKISTPKDDAGFKLVNVNTADYIAQGYTSVTVTISGASNVVWLGNDTWGGDDKYIIGVSENENWTGRIDLTDARMAGKFFTMQFGQETDVIITVTFNK